MGRQAPVVGTPLELDGIGRDGLAHSSSEKGITRGEFIHEMLIDNLAPCHYGVGLFENGISPETVAPYDAVIFRPLQVKMGLRDTLGNEIYRPEHLRDCLEHLNEVVVDNRGLYERVELGKNLMIPPCVSDMSVRVSLTDGLGSFLTRGFLPDCQSLGLFLGAKYAL